jgi:DNA-binding CsgD family transcriptional regulator
MLSPTLSDDLLLSLLDGSFEAPAWSTFLDKLRELTGADYASLIFRPPGLGPNTVLHLFSGTRSPVVIQQLYRANFLTQDPTPYHSMTDGRVYSLDELLHREDPAHEAFFEQIMAPSGMNEMRMVRTVEASGVTAWLTITRREEDFCARDDELLTQITPYLRAVLRSFIALERERVNSLLAGEVIHRLNCGWIALDAKGKVLETDARGGQFLADSTVLGKNAKGYLKVNTLESGEKIIDVIQKMIGPSGDKARCVILNRDPWIDMLIVPADQASHSAKSMPAVIAYVQGDISVSAERCEQLCQLFKLSPSEARLALALARGLSIAEAAQELDLTLETTRTYSKKIYAKVGARGHADLVRIIHRSLLRIA